MPLCTAVGAPKIKPRRPGAPNDLLQGEAFPGGAELGMGGDLLVSFEPQEGVDEP